MYNPQPETFLRVTDAGSFNRAAEEAFITPTAVIKQMNLLEDTLGVKLWPKIHAICSGGGEGLNGDNSDEKGKAPLIRGGPSLFRPAKIKSPHPSMC